METSSNGIAMRSGGQAEGWIGLVVTAFDRLLLWQERARDRRHLASLDNHMLRDIGLSRADLDAEVTKPFWQA